MSDNTEPNTDPLQRVLAEILALRTEFSEVKERLTVLETKVEERSRETRPIWEQALKEIMDVKEEVKATNTQLYILSSRDLRQDGELLTLKSRLDRIDNDPNAPTGRLP